MEKSSGDSSDRLYRGRQHTSLRQVILSMTSLELTVAQANFWDLTYGSRRAFARQQGLYVVWTNLPRLSSNAVSR